MADLTSAEAAQTISIDTPDGFDGALYNISASINYGSPSEFECSFLIKSGGVSSLYSYLDTEIVKTININGKSINVFPVSYHHRENPNEDVVSIKYRDSSVKYLDKTLVMLLGLQASQQQENSNSKIIAIGRFVSTYNIEEDEIRLIEIKEGDRGYDNYDPNFQISYPLSALKAGMSQKSIPMTTRCLGFLNNSSNSRLCKSYFGNLRSVLSSWGSDLGLLFFWNPFSFGGALDCMDISDSSTYSTAAIFTPSLLQYITSRSEGVSIEDTFTKSGTAISVLPIENSESIISISSVGSYKFRLFDCAFDILKGLDDFSVSKSDIDMNILKYNIKYKNRDVTEDFRKAVSAAMSGPEFFKKYLIYTMINGAIEKESTIDDALGNKGLIDPRTGLGYSIANVKNSSYNTFLYDYYHKYYRVAFCGVYKKSENDDKLYEGKGYRKDIYADLEKNDEISAIWSRKDDAPIYAAYLMADPDLSISAGVDKSNYTVFGDIESDILFNRLSLFGSYVGRYFYRECEEQSFNRTDFRGGGLSWYEENLSVHAGSPFSEIAAFLFPEIKDPKIEKFVKFLTGEEGGTETVDLYEREYSYINKLKRDGIAVFDSGASRGVNNLGSKLASDIVDNMSRSSQSYMDFIDSLKSGAKPFLVYLATKSDDFEKEMLCQNSSLKRLKHQYIVFDKTSGSANASRPVSPPVLERRIGNLSNNKVSSNSVETTEISPEDLMLTYNIRYGKDKIEKKALSSMPSAILKEYADLFFYDQSTPSSFSDYTFSIIPTFSEEWISSGLESIGISYGGDGISCQIRFSTQRRASYTMEMMSRKIAQNLLGNKNYSDIKDSFNKFPVRFKNKYLRPS